MPSVQESSVSILARIEDGFRNGYPGSLEDRHFIALYANNRALGEVFQQWSEQYGHTFSFGSLSDKWAILATQFQNFEKGLALTSRPFFINTTKVFSGVGVFNSDGEMWKFHRTTARPFFSKARISDFDNFERHAVNTISQIKTRLREGYPVNFQVRTVVSRFTMDFSTEYLFGKDINSLAAGLPYPSGSPMAGNPHFVNHPSNPFVKAFMKAQEQIIIRLQRGPSWPLHEFWADAVLPQRQVINHFVQPILSEAFDRKAKRVKPADSEKDLENIFLLDRLIQDIDDPEVIQDELINILLARRDTTASLLTFVVYRMCEHPDMVAWLRSKIVEKVGNRKPTYEDIRDMKYLQAFLNETLRLHPTVSSKVVTTLLNKGQAPYYIPITTRVVYSVFLMHQRMDLWGPDALEFDPDRFLDSRVHKYLTPNPYIFLPFNAGPRICLGQQFAYNKASYYLIRLLQNFSSFSLTTDAQPSEGIPPRSWTPAPGTTKGRDRIMYGIHITLYAKGGLWVKMEETKEEAAL
ncbi:cytochrome P450 [Desarmillaria ectypa]|nr:cytochrome P450 [Desarmillaria ectypa]